MLEVNDGELKEMFHTKEEIPLLVNAYDQGFIAWNFWKLVEVTLDVKFEWTRFAQQFMQCIVVVKCVKEVVKTVFDVFLGQ